MGEPVQVSAPPLLIKLPINPFWEAADKDLNAWVPATHMGNPYAFLGSWIWLDPGQAIVGIWGMNKQMEDVLSLSFSPSLPSILSLLLCLSSR